MVMALEPVIKGIVADQDVVPDAFPDCPKLVAQVIDAIPTLSLAVPETIIEADEVENVDVPGDMMLSAGGAPPGVGVGGGVGVGVGVGTTGGTGAGAGAGTIGTTEVGVPGATMAVA